MIALLAAVLVAAAPPPAAPPTAECLRTRLRVVQEAPLVLPEGVHPTNPRVLVLADLGSDGRVRRSVIAESSGDAAVDEAAAKALGQFRFAAASFGCMSSSGAIAQEFTIPPEAIGKRPVTGPSAPVVACAAPFVRPMGISPPTHREAAGTATVEVALDAAASVTGVRLVQSSGNPKADHAATAAARNAGYRIEPLPGCLQAATTYNLEITFH